MAEQFKYRLFLDDIRTPKDVPKYWPNADKIAPYSEDVWVVVRNFNAFCKAIKLNGIPEFISFDHDLSDQHYRPSMYNPDGHYSQYYTDGTFTEKTGYDCAKWLIDYCKTHKKALPLYAIHSMNPIGAKNIDDILQDYLKNNR
jgi:hypothetical protein